MFVKTPRSTFEYSLDNQVEEESKKENSIFDFSNFHSTLRSPNQCHSFFHYLEMNNAISEESTTKHSDQSMTSFGARAMLNSRSPSSSCMLRPLTFGISMETSEKKKYACNG